MKSLWYLAYRNIWRRKRRSFLNITAITISVTIVISFLCMYRGFYGMTIDNVIELQTGHFQYHHPEYQKEKRRFPIDLTIPNPSKISDIVSQRIPNGKIDRLEHIIRFQAIVAHQGKKYGAMGVGQNLILGQENTLMRNIEKGTYFSSPIKNQAKNEIIIGHELAKLLNVDIGDEISLLTHLGEGEQNFDYFTVLGIFNVGFYETDKGMIFLPLKTTQIFLGFENQVTEVGLKLKGTLTEFWLVDPTLKSIAEETGLHGQNWMELMPNLMDDLKGDLTFFFIFAFILIFMTAMGIANTTHMNIFDRKKEIGTLRALGMSARLVTRLLNIEIVVLCFIGIVLGSLLGTLSNIYIENIGITFSYMEDLTDQISLPMGNIMYGESAWYDYPLVAGVMIIAAWLGAISPIRKINKVQIREALGEGEKL